MTKRANRFIAKCWSALAYLNQRGNCNWPCFPPELPEPVKVSGTAVTTGASTENTHHHHHHHLNSMSSCRTTLSTTLTITESIDKNMHSHCAMLNVH
ncbi:hypothetical protein TYRP_005992 [Tyrophagus putrescentiae]|nr:hypothetical protein TYRP_005992 [Tyrophagus putrescentiae]